MQYIVRVTLLAIGIGRHLAVVYISHVRSEVIPIPISSSRVAWRPSGKSAGLQTYRFQVLAAMATRSFSLQGTLNPDPKDKEEGFLLCPSEGTLSCRSWETWFKLALFPDRRRNGLATSASSNCIWM